MFDLIFDAGNNPAVPPQGYWIRQLRLVNLLNFAPLLTTEDLDEFWDMFKAQNSERFAKLIRIILDRARATPFDQRTTQIFGDVLDWGSKHPEAILDPFGKRDSPNFVAFTALFQHLHSFNKETGHFIGCFVHDQQDQFVPSFKESFEFLTQFHGELDDPFSTVADMEEMSTFDCQMEVRPSDSSFGLQLVDLCMWLSKRMIDQNNKPTGQCASLAHSIINNGWITEYDFRSLVNRVKLGAEYIQNLPVTEEQMRRAREILAEIELKRHARMLEYEKSRTMSDPKSPQ